MGGTYREATAEVAAQDAEKASGVGRRPVGRTSAPPPGATVGPIISWGT